ncbi:MAG: IS21 family transposase [Hydrogenophaga sp.]|uniref:IS21 family transposase n=1 Tax=Hydrogenophaga sp. TaxID=1904254 RepID=UPI002ABA664B|nr:IS21 family transposase [Hydrogenophaga sp.]MDZ4283893.1 IS21 family transposase [Hydrogenophaga sp.]
MRKTLEILRLHFEAGASGRAIALAVCVALSTVQECLRRFLASGLTWPVDLDEPALEARLYPREAVVSVPLPDFAAMQTALLGHKAMTRRHLWEQYRAAHPEGLGYSAFCAHYASFTERQKLILRREHAPGVAMLIDYAGPSLFVVDRLTGEQQPVRLFVAVLGYSNYTFACATPGETTADWLAAQVAALEAFGGVPQTAIPDNPKALIRRACRYEPELNPAYQDFAQHYGIAILPARVRKPRDKAKAETAVQIVERALMPILLAQQFFSLGDLNTAIGALIAELNARAFQKLPGTRCSWFAEERGLLKPLPAQRYEYAQWKQAKVHLDYHVEVDKHAYSVPHVLIGKRLDVRLAARTVEIFLRGKSVAVHVRSARTGGFTTLPEHRPPQHRSLTDLSIEKLYRQAEAIGPHTLALLREQSQHKKHYHETLRSSLGILRLAKDFSNDRLEAACKRALLLKTVGYRAVRNLIEHPPAEPAPAPPKLAHENVRGATYFGAGPC